ncbi:pentatricopeptide repeat-containing protein At4g21065-like [Cucurbita moschata]|uniref:Pentatricopeptide repeat-containing protein At4g21065-like n=1 Tax=Cucurbita moschata TaxID=3662 RepID=A0A6J1F295_CUCMO|nr:pentatricopeptide repeat-containing protein At4g21065-like [Cucurbita moschata]
MTSQLVRKLGSASRFPSDHPWITRAGSFKNSQELEEEERFAFLIRKCPNMRVLRQLHAHILTRPLPLSTFSFALSKITVFCALSPLGNIDYARLVFAQISRPSIFSWNSLIKGCSKIQNPSKEPIALFQKLTETGYPVPNSFTMAFVLKACAIVTAFEEGLQVHSRVLKDGFGSSSFVQTSLVNFYGKCEEIGLATKVFDEMPDRNLVAWTAMISGHVRVGAVDEAMGLFREMQKAGVEPDAVTLVSVVSACAAAGALDIGSWVHAYIEKHSVLTDLELGTALVDMYAKCGCIERAKQVFVHMPVRDTRAWSSMIMGFAYHGLSEDAIGVFRQMLEAEVMPDRVTFIGILSACAHGGIVSEGLRFWSLMLECGIEPSVEHYGCIVDLLCRTGLVEEAYRIVTTTNIPSNPATWRSLLKGCKKKKLSNLGEIVARYLLQLEPLNAENYIVISNLYSSVSQWEKMSELRKEMKENDVKPIPGCSSIEVDGVVHEFEMGDQSHPEVKILREFMEEMAKRVWDSGYRPSVSDVLHKVMYEEKEGALGEHSERFAIAYGLLKTRAPVVIRVVKNLRVCGDCHEVIKIISKIYEREIIVRDRVRFHKFVEGTCSCKDYW